MGYVLGKRSLRNLVGVHPDLVAVVKRAIKITEGDFTVIEGLRTKRRQQLLVAKGASKTMNSRHITGHAVDIVSYPITTKKLNDKRSYLKLAKAMKQAAKDLNIPIEWGGDWGWDSPHFQLPRDKYKG